LEPLSFCREWQVCPAVKGCGCSVNPDFCTQPIDVRYGGWNGL
jgi:hypothetical protein